MSSKKIGIVVLATNAYFVLGVRFIKKFVHHYHGSAEVTFHFFSDEDPAPYLSEDSQVVFHKTSHESWVEATNDKFRSILSLEESSLDYLYYFDADTNVSKNFNETWFLGELVGGEHYGNRGWLANGAGFDKNPQSKAYVPADTHLPCTYYYGAFFGGRINRVMEFCRILREWQIEDKKIPYEPGVNDESYINAYFHYNPPTTVKCEDFAFEISHKAGLGETRDTGLDVSGLKRMMLENRDSLYEITGTKIKIL
jgi:Glycosyltransferase family 6